VATLHADIVFTSDLYQDFLRRDPDPVGLANWLSYLLAGGSVSNTPELLGLEMAQPLSDPSPTTVMDFILNGTNPGDGIAPQTYTRRNVSGPLNLNGVAIQLTHVPTGATAGDTFTIIHTTGGVTGTFAGLPEGATVTAQDGSQFTISYLATGGNDVTLTAITPAGFSYDAASKSLTINAAGAPFTYSQGSFVDLSGNVHTTYDLALNGQTIAYPDAQVSQIIVSSPSRSISAGLITADNYIGLDGQMHETVEAVRVGDGGAKVQKLDAQGGIHDFLTLTGVQNAYALAGPADQGFIDSTPGVKNVFVGAGSYAYMNTGNSAEDFYYIKGAKFVYGYASGPGDFAYQYDGSGPSYFTVSGTAYSIMIGTDSGVIFQNYAIGFRFNVGIADHGWQDTATFYDSPGSDRFTGFTSYSSMTSADGSFQEYDAAAFFGQVNAYSFVGGSDTAYNYDPNHVHTYGFIRLN
jgi:hypothetical protein